MDDQSQAHKIITNFLLSQNTHRSATASPPPPAYTFHPSQTNITANPEQYDDEEEESSPTPITIHISTPLTITGHSNLILLPPPSTTAKTLALEVLRALKTSSIPMIDEDGRPRGVDVRIEAGIRIEGRGNVVGEKAGLEGLRRVIRNERDGLRGRSGVVGNGNGRKRRASSAPVAEREGKRERIA